MIDITPCEAADVPALMGFIDQHWRKDHVLATSRDLMDWQHKDENGKYNYLLAKRGDELLGVLGYIPTRRYDPALAQNNILWLALWIIRDDCKVAGLGLRMLQALNNAEECVGLAVNGINLAHPPMYKSLGYEVAELKQYYLVNPKKKPTLIASTATDALAHPAKGDSVFREVSVGDLEKMRLAANATPHKTPIYFASRFLRHPFYRYRVFTIGEDALIATRIAQHANAKALRIVDFAGNPAILSRCGTAFEKLMRQEDAEYADFWQHGLPHDTLTAAGFGVVDPEGSIIVPNYYEPFLARNGRIVSAIKSKTAAPVIVCRADGDQDRPNESH